MKSPSRTKNTSVRQDEAKDFAPKIFFNFWSSLLNLWARTEIRSRDGNSAAYAAARCCWCAAPRSVATKICTTSQRQRSVAYYNFIHFFYQRWCPRGRPWPRGRPRRHILKSLALASKPQVLENCPVLGSRTALFFGQLKFCWKTPATSRKICEFLFCFCLLEHRRSQGRGPRGPVQPPIKISPMTKM